MTTSDMTANIDIDNASRTAGKAAAWHNAAAWTLDDEILVDRSHTIANSLHQAGIQLQTEAARFYSSATELFDKANREERLDYRVAAGKLERHADDLQARGDALRDAMLTVRGNMSRPAAPQL